jgi:formate-dependent nitrite reductase membrane component NrfD
MNYFVADPEWGVWITAYFYLGGIAAGVYFLAVLIEWFGPKEARPLAGIAYRLAFPLVLLCTAFLIVDLGRPERFWHMMFKSEVMKEAFAVGFPWTAPGWETAVRAPVFKYWSPMSAGSWALAVFGACTFVSFVGEFIRSFVAAFFRKDRGERVRRAGVFGWVWGGVHLIFQVVGCLAGFFVASYTGVLLEATNQPVWSDTTWLGPLFLASAASTGLAALRLIAWWRNVGPREARERLGRAEPLALGLELVLLAVFAASLGAAVVPVLTTVRGQILLTGTLAAGILAPGVLHFAAGRRPWAAPAAAACVLLGGLLLRYGAVSTPAELLARGPTAAVAERPVGTPEGWLDGTALQKVLTPEAARERGERGADVNNRPGPVVVPRSKLPRETPEGPDGT